jgi:hypothetical protein
MKMYKIVTVDQNGYVATQQDLISTLKEAEEEAANLVEIFEGSDFWAEEYEYEHKEAKQYNYNAVDGWEDLYPLEE